MQDISNAVTIDLNKLVHTPRSTWFFKLPFSKFSRILYLLYSFLCKESDRDSTSSDSSDNCDDQMIPARSCYVAWQLILCRQQRPTRPVSRTTHEKYSLLPVDEMIRRGGPTTRSLVLHGLPDSPLQIWRRDHQLAAGDHSSCDIGGRTDSRPNLFCNNIEVLYE